METYDDGRLTIAHVLTSLAIGGGERVALMLAAAQVRQGHRVMVVSLEEQPDGELVASFEAAGVRVCRFRKRPGLDLRLTRTLWSFFRREAIDVVHTHNPLPLVYATLAAKAAGARVVHTKHGPHPDRAHRIWLRRLGALATDAFVAVSEDTASFATELREVHPDKLSVVQNGIDLSCFRPDAERRQRQRTAWGLDSASFVIGTVGRMAPVKNHALLLRAAAPLLGARCRLVIAGDGPERANTEALARKLQIAQWVHLLGAIDDIPSVLSAFDLFALSSHVEGLPLALTEAMACGLPTVATSVGGVPQVVDDGRTGLLVRPDDERAFRAALAKLKDAPLLRSALGAAGRSRAQREFSSTRMLREYGQLYRPGDRAHASGAPGDGAALSPR
jgi:glycosyltransferase involved in cell wall biosynthesis